VGSCHEGPTYDHNANSSRVVGSWVLIRSTVYTRHMRLIAHVLKGISFSPGASHEMADRYLTGDPPHAKYSGECSFLFPGYL